MSILVHSSAIPVHSCGFLPIPADSCAIPADSSGMGSFLQESVGHGEVLYIKAWIFLLAGLLLVSLPEMWNGWIVGG